MTWLALRMIAILLGVAAAVGLAQSSLGFRFPEEFLPLLERVDDLIGVFTWPFGIFLERVVRYLQEQGFAFELHDHWHGVFVLLWLFNGSFSRNLNTPPNFRIAAADMRDLLGFAPAWIWAAVTAFLGSAFAGTVPLQHPAVLLWPIAAFFLFRAGDNLMIASRGVVKELVGAGFALTLATLFTLLAVGVIDTSAIAGNHSAQIWWPTSAYFLYVASSGIPYSGVRATAALAFTVAAIALACALGTLPTPAWLHFDGSPSPGLATLLAFIVIIAVWILIQSLLLLEFKGGHALLDSWSGGASVGIDILLVLGIATTFIWFARMT
ncbi:MAG: hypothetical protein ABL973_11230 [Micropepsaceae bacterium]